MTWFIVRLRRTFNNHSNINHHSTKYHKEWDWSNNVLRFVCSKMIFFLFCFLFLFLFLRLFISSSFLLIFLWLWDLFLVVVVGFFYYQREILIRQQQSERNLKEVLKFLLLLLRLFRLYYHLTVWLHLVFIFLLSLIQVISSHLYEFLFIVPMEAFC